MSSPRRLNVDDWFNENWRPETPPTPSIELVMAPPTPPPEPLQRRPIPIMAVAPMMRPAALRADRIALDNEPPLDNQPPPAPISASRGAPKRKRMRFD